jgi:hypothetical protein
MISWISQLKGLNFIIYKLEWLVESVNFLVWTGLNFIILDFPIDKKDH